jgi:hypothetical protein
VRTLSRLFILLIAAAAAEPRAVQEFDALLKQAQAAKKAGDTKAHLSAVLELETFLHHSPGSVESTAFAYADAGNDREALQALSEFAGMGSSDDLIAEGKRGDLARFKKNPEYLSILSQLDSNQTPVMKAQVATVLSDVQLLPEDIDFDPVSRSFLITSVLEKRIVRVSLSGQVTNFALSPRHWPMLALKIDPVRGLVWATEVALDGFSLVPREAWGKSALLCFDLRSGELLHRIDGPAKSALGDMSLQPDGTPILSDGDGGGVYRLRGDRLELIDDRDFISPQTSVPLPGTSFLLVPDYTRGIALLDSRNGKVEWLSSSGAKPVALSGVDGLYYSNGNIILTQNGTTPERVIEMRLDASRTDVISERIIARGGSDLGDPTHGVIFGSTFYFIADSGWNHLDEHGDLKQGEHLTPAAIMQYKLD